MSHKIRYIVIVVLTIFIIACIYYFGSGKFYEQRQKDIIFKETSSLCDLHLNSCNVSFDEEKSISLNIENKPLFSNEELLYVVNASGFEDNELLLSIVGVKMNMGLFEQRLIKKQDGIYEGKLLLPACMSGLMKWKISVISQKDSLGANFIIDLKNK